MKAVLPPKSSEVYPAVLLHRRRLSDNAVEIEITKPSSFDFTPGQGIRFIHESLERDYSLISTPADANLALCVRVIEKGFFSPLLASASIGSSFSFTGPLGYFTFRSSLRPPVFVATGTGVAPFVSMVRSGTSGFTLLHGVRTTADLYYEPLLRAAARHYIPCLSGGASNGSVTALQAFGGRVTDYLKQHLPPGVYDFYLCGRSDMIRDVTLLVDEHFPGSLVYTEIFF